MCWNFFEWKLRRRLYEGGHHVHLDTMSWQAPEFYKKQGYEVIGVLADIPKENQKYLLMKRALKVALDIILQM